jgi:hypothetical protein
MMGTERRNFIRKTSTGILGMAAITIPGIARTSDEVK